MFMSYSLHPWLAYPMLSVSYVDLSRFGVVLILNSLSSCIPFMILKYNL